jgi:beta-lactamase superfamily II metal-dependent hydrolase
MSTIMSYAVGSGDMFCIRHNSDNFTVIDCDLNDQNAAGIIADLRQRAAGKGMSRFICTHPDEDHFGGIEILDQAMPIENFYCVRNQAIKDRHTPSFQRYCQLRDGSTAYYIYQGCTRRWLNQGDAERGSAGINVLWPDVSNAYFRQALANCDAGSSFNNTSAVIRYHIEDGASFMWLGDLETQFMENIRDSIILPKTTVVFASHHGRHSGKIPNSWLYDLDPQIIIIGEAPTRHLNYYTGYQTLTQNQAGDILMDCVNGRVDFYLGNPGYAHLPTSLWNAGLTGTGYVGSLTVEHQYTR